MEMYLQVALIVLGTMLLSIEMCKFAGISSTIGYIMSGIGVKIILGDGKYTVATDWISEIAISFLMFVIGLKISPKDLKSFQVYTKFGVGQVLLTSIAGSILIFLLFPSLPMGIIAVVSCGISLSSTALCSQLIGEKRQNNADSSKKTMAALLIQDFFAILVVMCMQSMLFLRNHPGASILSILSTYGLSIFTVIGMIYVINPLLNNSLRLIVTNVVPESTLIFAMVLVFGMSLVTNRFNLSPELGPFIAGVLIAGTKYKEQIMSEVYNVSKVLLALFFVSVGISIDLLFMKTNWIAVCIGVIIVMVMKTGIAMALLGIQKEKQFKENLKAAILLSGLGEFSYVIVGNLKKCAPLDSYLEYLLQVMTIVTALSLITSSIGYGLLCDSHGQMIKSDYNVILVGLTKKTELLAEVLQYLGISYIMIEKDPTRLEYAASLGIHAKFGDSENTKLITSLAKDAQILVLGFEAHLSRAASINKMCQLFPESKIICYASDETILSKISFSNIELLLFSKKEQSLKLAARVLESLGWNRFEAEEVLRNLEQ